MTSTFFDLIIDILFFDSDYFDSILKNCTDRIFSHVPHYFCGQDHKILSGKSIGRKRVLKEKYYSEPYQS